MGSSADVFQSLAAEIIRAMIFGFTVATESNMPPHVAAKIVLFPLLVHAVDIVISTAGILLVGMTQDTVNADPMKALQRQDIRRCLSIGFRHVGLNWLCPSYHILI